MTINTVLLQTVSLVQVNKSTSVKPREKAILQESNSYNWIARITCNLDIPLKRGCGISISNNLGYETHMSKIGGPHKSPPCGPAKLRTIQTIECINHHPNQTE